jgi:hypothetical protein
MTVKLFPHQHKFVTDTTSRYLALIAGFGAGKSFAFCMKAIHLASVNVAAVGDCVGILCEPTYPLINDVLIPSMEEALEICGITSYTIKKTGGTPEITIKFSNGICTLKMRSAENFRRLIGINASFAGIDELDTMATDIQKGMWKAINARIRKQGSIRQTFVTSTPEGHKFTYQQFVVAPSEKPELAAQTRIIKASSYDNPTLPKEYIDDNIANFSAEEKQAWVDGDFVNMTSGRIYRKYDRHLNRTTTTIDSLRALQSKNKDSRGMQLPLPGLHIGMDFNIDKMAAVVHIITREGPHAIDELIGLRDTEHMVEVIKDKYPDFNISVYPDSSGKNRSHASVFADTDISLLRNAKFIVVYDSQNPAVRDRINSMNNAFCDPKDERKYKVNDKSCPKYAQSLEQQVYDAHGQPDKQGGWDHACDAGGYFIWQKFPLRRYQAGTLRMAGLY